jgi:cAMP-dependent protein kinase regulator
MERLRELAEKIGKVFEEGDVVFQQGDMGDMMYILHEGSLAVVREKDGTGTVVARLTRGDVVGEMALVDEGPRSATVKAIERSILVPVTRDFLLKHTSRDTKFILTLIESLGTRLEKLDEMLEWRIAESDSSPQPLDGLEDEPRSAAFLKSLSQVIDTTKGVRLSQGDVIFQKGDPGDNMYIVLDGKVKIYREEDGKRFVQAQFGRGNFFGEMAIVSGKARVASAAAAAPSVLLPVGKQAFLEKILTDPAVALHIIQILIVRLRRSLRLLG